MNSSIHTKALPFAAGLILTASMCGLSTALARPASHSVRHHGATVTVNSLHLPALVTKQSGAATALAPQDWAITASDYGTVELYSPKQDAYAGWCILPINRQMQAYYGNMYGPPEQSIQAFLSAGLRSMGNSGDVEYTSAPKQYGYFVERTFKTSQKRGRIFYHIYGDPNSQYIESVYIGATNKELWVKEGNLVSAMALTIRGHVALHASPSSSVSDPSDPSAHADKELKDYNAQLGMQDFTDPRTGEHYWVNPNEAEINGPEGPGVYKRAGNDLVKLDPGYN